MSADVIGSSVSDVEQVRTLLFSHLTRHLLQEQMEGIVAKKINDGKPLDYQLQVMQSREKTVLLEAGCGAGKTVAAYLWASKHAHSKRLYICYPTTGTASEGFAGYIREPDFESLLIHSKAGVDYRLLTNMPTRSHEENEMANLGIEALNTWHAPVIVCTAHTVLGILENTRRGLYAFPSIIQSALVFDEIHAYSSRLFSYLLRFLESFPGLSVLLMTATLPRERRLALQNVAQQRGGISIVQGPKQREESLRYEIKRSSETDVWKEVVKAIEKNEKVLWVCNTVSRAEATFENALKLGIPVESYHSRYRYMDRIRRHETVVKGFDPIEPALLAVTTQVAEMSLDLSADLLVSDRAPISSMIQRMGRLNRRGDCPASVKAAIFLEPERTLPYSDEQMIGSEEWLSELSGGRNLSQQDLAESFKRLNDESAETVRPVEHCEWLDGLFRSRITRNVEESGYAVEVIREEDLAIVRRQPHEAAAYALPMPFPHHADWRNWSRFRHYLIAPMGSLFYDEKRGGQWRRN